jgi:hypothetical protein
MGSMTKVTVGLPIVERIGTCSRQVSEQLFRTTPTMLLKRAERALAIGIAMRSNGFARKFSVLEVWIWGLFLRSPKRAPKPMTIDITVTTKTLNPKRVWRRPYTSLSRSGAREPERQLPQGREGSDGLEEPEDYTQKVRLDSGSQSSDEP